MSLALSDALALLHEVLAFYASESSSRFVVVKGRIANEQVLRDRPGPSGDVDILVHPEDFQEVVRFFADLGWVARTQAAEEPRLLPYHSVTLMHEHWPCDVDVHRYFPGMFASPEPVVEYMWERSGRVSLACGELPVPARGHHALVLLLNQLRSKSAFTGSADESTLAQALRDPQTYADFRELAIASRATDVVTQWCTEHLGRALPRTVDEAELRAWRLWTDADGGGLNAYLETIHRGALGMRLRALARALWKPVGELRAENPLLEPGVRGALTGEAQRWMRGLRQVPQTLRSFRRAPRTLGTLRGDSVLNAEPVPQADAPVGAVNLKGNEPVVKIIRDRAPSSEATGREWLHRGQAYLRCSAEGRQYLVSLRPPMSVVLLDDHTSMIIEDLEVQSLDDVASDYAELFAADEQQIKRDLEGFADTLRSLGVLVSSRKGSE